MNPKTLPLLLCKGVGIYLAYVGIALAYGNVVLQNTAVTAESAPPTLFTKMTLLALLCLGSGFFLFFRSETVVKKLTAA